MELTTYLAALDALRSCAREYKGNAEDAARRASSDFDRHRASFWRREYELTLDAIEDLKRSKAREE